MDFKTFFYIKESQELNEAPWGEIDYELERFMIPNIPKSINFKRLEDFFKYLYVGDDYRGYRQERVNLKNFDSLYDEIESNEMLKRMIEKEFHDFLPNAKYFDFLMKVKAEATTDEIKDYIQSILEANRDRKQYEEKRL